MKFYVVAIGYCKKLANQQPWFNIPTIQRQEFCLITSQQLTTNVFVRSISAVLLAVAEEILLDTGAVTAGQLTGLIAQGGIGHQQGLHLPLSGQFITVLHSPFPVTGLLLEIESQTWRTSDSLQTLVWNHLSYFTSY